MKKIQLKHVRIVGSISPILGIFLILLGCWLKIVWLIYVAIFVMLAGDYFSGRF